MDNVLNLVGNYIFPIAMCLIIFWKMERDQDRYREDLNSMRAVIEANTNVMTQIKTMMERGD